MVINKDKREDSLRSYLKKLKVDDIDEKYDFFLNAGLVRAEDIKRYLYDFVSLNDDGVEEEDLVDLVDFYKDLLKQDKTLKKDLKTVTHLAYAFHKKHERLPLGDFVQIACMGYLEAKNKYEKGCNLPFNDYLNYYCIMAMIDEYEKEKKEWKK